MSVDTSIDTVIESDALVEPGVESDAPSRYVDAATADLNSLAATFEDVQNSRIRAENRGDAFSAELLQATEKRIGRQLGKVLAQHDLYDWLPKGLGGPRTARVIAAIGDPRRFPGQQCTEGHTLPPLYEERSPCPVESVDSRGETDKRSDNSPGTDDEPGEDDIDGVRCPGTMRAPRASTGVRSLWHYFGLMPGADGTLLSRQKGVQATFSPQGRALILGDKGIADQIVLHRAEPYRTKYDEFKSRRVADAAFETVETPGVPPWRLNKIAKIVAAKAFLGDMLTEWKKRVEVSTPIGPL